MDFLVSGGISVIQRCLKKLYKHFFEIETGEYTMAQGLTVEQIKKEYFKVFFALLLFTAITVGAAYVHFGAHWLNILVGVVIAAIKSAMVIWIFMHIKFDNKYLRAMIVVPLFFSIVMMFALTQLETFPPDSKEVTPIEHHEGGH